MKFSFRFDGYVTSSVDLDANGSLSVEIYGTASPALKARFERVLITDANATAEAGAGAENVHLDCGFGLDGSKKNKEIGGCECIPSMIAPPDVQLRRLAESADPPILSSSHRFFSPFQGHNTANQSDGNAGSDGRASSGSVVFRLVDSNI
ncbi:hypothetical protein GYMLUDRAFT_237281 [Collybiopsis luxurians FD-317 M1]|nr:hypothetical protein GYMLUDRAFT_237281 [Collybiopsis luxurians FD-317 M1]